MRIACLLAALMLLPSASRAAERLAYVTGGPMFHWNFNGYRFSGFSFGLEFAYWNFAQTWEEGFLSGPLPDTDRPGYGFALGFDSDRKNFRMYAEPQIGWVWAGLSLGPVLELSETGGPARWGIQGSGWANIVVGLDLRYRYVDDRLFQALGLYARMGTQVSGGGDPPE